MKRAVIYARFSSSNQREESIDGQLRVCGAFADTKKVKVVDEYIDRAISGRTDNRPDFQRLMRDSTKNQFDIVIVYATDRFARNKYDSAIYKSALKKSGVEIWYATEHIPAGPEGIILESLLEGMAEYYSARLSESVKRGIYENAQKGLSVGGKMLGYKLAVDKTFEINEKEAETVRLIFDLYVNQKSVSGICDHLNALGLRSSRGRPFVSSTVQRILKNEKYIGVYDYAGTRIEDGMPAIIEKEVFTMAQVEIERRRTSKKERGVVANYMLSGKLFCAHCDGKMTGISGTSGKCDKKFYYYKCINSRGRNKTCTNKTVRKDWLENLVGQETSAHILKTDTIKYIAKACCEIQLDTTEGRDEIAFYQQRIAENKKATANIMKIIEAGTITETLPARLRELELEATALQQQLKSAEKVSFELTPEHIEFMLLQFLEKGEDEEAWQQNIINTFITSVHLSEASVLIYYNISKDMTDLATSELSLLASSEFDQQGVTSWKQKAKRNLLPNRFILHHTKNQR